jgi:hypothetical protein
MSSSLRLLHDFCGLGVGLYAGGDRIRDMFLGNDSEDLISPGDAISLRPRDKCARSSPAGRVAGGTLVPGVETK